MTTKSLLTFPGTLSPIWVQIVYAGGGLTCLSSRQKQAWDSGALATPLALKVSQAGPGYRISRTPDSWALWWMWKSCWKSGLRSTSYMLSTRSGAVQDTNINIPDRRSVSSGEWWKLSPVEQWRITDSMQSSANSWRDALRSATALQGFRDLTKGEKSFESQLPFQQPLSQWGGQNQLPLELLPGARGLSLSGRDGNLWFDTDERSPRFLQLW